MRRAVAATTQWAASAASLGGRGAAGPASTSGAASAGAAALAAGKTAAAWGRRGGGPPRRGFAAQPATAEEASVSAGPPPPPPPTTPPGPPPPPPPSKPPVTVHERLVFNLYMLRARAHAKGWKPGTAEARGAGSALVGRGGAAQAPAAPAAPPPGTTAPPVTSSATADSMLFAPIQALIGSVGAPKNTTTTAQAAPGLSSSPAGGPVAISSYSALADADPDVVLDLWGRQIELERSGLEEARARYEAQMVAAVAGGVGADHAPASGLMSHMYQSAVASIRAEQVAIKAAEKGEQYNDRWKLGTRLLLVDAETLAVIALHNLIKATLVPGPANGGRLPGGHAAPGPGSGAATAAHGIAAASGVGSYGRYTTAKDLAAAARVVGEGGGLQSPEAAAAAVAAAADAPWRLRTGGKPAPPRSVAPLEPRLEARLGSVAMSIGRTVQAQVSLERLREAVRREKAVRAPLTRALEDAVERKKQAPGGELSPEQEAALLSQFREISDKQGWGPPKLEALPSMAAAMAREGGAEGKSAAASGVVEAQERFPPPHGEPPMSDDEMIAAIIATTKGNLGGRRRIYRPPPALPSPASDLGKRLKRLEKELASRDRANGSAMPRQDVAARALRDLNAGLDWPPDECVKVGAMLVRCLIAGCTIPVPLERADALESAVAATGEQVSPLDQVDWQLAQAPVHLPPPCPETAFRPPASGATPRTVTGSPTRPMVTVPAFAHYERRWRNKRVGVVRAHDEIGRRAMGKSGLLAAAATPDYKPMLVPPLPWRSATEGGHLVLKSFVVRPPRQPGAAQLLRSALKQADARPPMGLSRVYAALNALGAVGWRIHSPTLAAVEAAWAAGGDAAGLPSRTDLPPAPKPPPFYLRRPPATRPGELRPGLLASCEQPLERRFRVAANRYATKVNRETHGLRCDVELKLGVARQFAPEGAFFYPHNLDFRGRAYPMHPHLHHLGSDLCRGLLEFAEARPLGPDGYDWLLVQVANAWGQGVDKLSFEGRRAFAEEHLAQIHASAADPAACGWWAGGEDPWQLLQTCSEIRAADATGDPASYASRVPVRIDGSCNGLQHYAALGRDSEGGAAVNLVPGNAPRDVYQGVADVVARRVSRDAAKGVPAAVLLQGEVDRKLVKQTVMTSVYGVTFVGARGQVMDRLRERGFVSAHGGQNSREVFDAANYAARVTFDGLRELFGGARAIQTWLAEVAGKVASTGAPVSWTTPLGLPVVQPYRRARDHHVRTVLQRLVLVSPDPSSPVAVNRQRAAFPPNFIHALDSTHMMMTATAAAEAGLVFAGVHDSFWTHAGNVGQLSTILRDQFVALHSRPLLADLAEELAKAHPKVELPPLPATGDLNLGDVRESPYFFS